jgi:hypothetical protein
MKICQVGAQLLHTDRLRQTGRLEEAEEANSRFWQFCESAYKGSYVLRNWTRNLQTQN